MAIKLKKLLENIGDFAGTPTFAGTGNFGHGGYRQLAINLPNPNLKDKNNPDSATNPQFGMDHTEAGPEEYDEHPHFLPKEDETLREDPITDPGRSNYRDLPGFPLMNTLVNKKKFVPADQDQDRNFPEVNKDNIRVDLIPTGKDDAKPEYWGYGPLDDDIFNEELELSLIGNPSINNWKTTTRQNMGKINKSVNYGQLVDPHDFQDDLPVNDKELNKLDDKDDVLTNPGGMGTVLAPRNLIKTLTNEVNKKDDVEKFVDAMNPARHTGSGEATLTSPEDFTVTLESLIWNK